MRAAKRKAAPSAGSDSQGEAVAGAAPGDVDNEVKVLAILGQPSLRLRTVIDSAERWPSGSADLVTRGLAMIDGAAGDATGAALVAFLAPMRATVSADQLIALLDKRSEPNRLAAAYAAAQEEQTAGREDAAALLLGLITGWQSGRFDGFVGLAGLALARGAYAPAKVFAQEALKTGVKHPLAYCIAGLAELQKGDKKLGQSMLAASARHARADQRYRDILRIAQRALLMMHLS